MPNLHSRDFITGCFTTQRIHGPVLEVGSGRDRFNRELFSKRYKVTATNIYPKNVVDEICSVTSLPFKQAQFGCVICEHVLEHVEEPARAIEEMYRVLKPGGLLILVVPFSWPLHEKPYDLWRFTQEGMRLLLKERFERTEFELAGTSPKPGLIFITARRVICEKPSACPKVSVVMPTYNRASMVGASIESMLKQTLEDWELIIVSDGSTDSTEEVVKSYADRRIRFFAQKNKGSAAARNHALRVARGRYIAYCDDDDMLLPHHLATLAEYLDRHPEVSAIKAAGVAVQLTGKTGFRTLGFLWALMHRRSVLKKVGFFDEKLRVSQDLDFILRLTEACPLFLLDSIVVRHVLHEKGIVNVRRGQLSYYQDLVYAKRVKRAFCKNQLNEKELFMVIYMLQQSYPRAALALLQVSECPVSRKADRTYLAGLLHYNVGDYDKSVKYCEQLFAGCDNGSREAPCRSNKFKAFAGILMGRSHFSKKNFVVSLGCLLDAARFKTSLLPEVELLRYYRKRGEREEFLALRKRIKNKIVLLYAKGVELVWKKRYEDAVNVLTHQRLPSHDPLNYLFCELLADIYLEKGNMGLSDEYRQLSLGFERKAFFSVLFSESMLSIDKGHLRALVSQVLMAGGPEYTQVL